MGDAEKRKMEEEEPPPLPYEKPKGQIWDDFLGYTSTGGLGGIARWNHRFGKVFWGLVTTAAFVAWFYFVGLAIIKFFKYPYNVNVNIQFDKLAPFPAVTVCNNNPFRKTAVDKLRTSSSDFDDYFDDYAGKKRRKRSPSSYSSNYWDDYYDDVNYNEYDSSYQYTNSIYNYILKQTFEDQKSLGHQIDSMLMSCQFQGKTCTISNFTRSVNSKYNNCYTIHQYLSTNQTLIAAQKPGPRFGLTMELFAELDEYIPELAGAAGFRILIHDQSVVPKIDESGFDIPVGFYSSVGVQRVVINRLGGKYFDCYPPEIAGKKNIWSEIIEKSYSHSNCLYSCYQHDVATFCGCLDPRYPMDHSSLPTGLPECFGDAALTSCQQSYEDLIDLEAFTDCDCHKGCRDINFNVHSSQSTWPIPSSTALDEFLKKLETSKKPALRKWYETLTNSSIAASSTNGSAEAYNSTQLSMVDQVRYNVAKVTISFDDLNYEDITQVPSFTAGSLMSEIGGQMGLWIGFTVLSVVEYFELIGILLASCCIRKQLKRNSVENSPSEKPKAMGGYGLTKSPTCQTLHL